jgi:hypothetical protein
MEIDKRIAVDKTRIFLRAFINEKYCFWHRCRVGKLCEPNLRYSEGCNFLYPWAMESLKFHRGSPCPALLCPADEPPLKRPQSSFSGGTLLPLDTPSHMPYAPMPPPCLNKSPFLPFTVCLLNVSHISPFVPFQQIDHRSSDHSHVTRSCDHVR